MAWVCQHPDAADCVPVVAVAAGAKGAQSWVKSEQTSPLPHPLWVRIAEGFCWAHQRVYSVLGVVVGVLGYRWIVGLGREDRGIPVRMRRNGTQRRRAVLRLQ